VALAALTCSSGGIGTLACGTCVARILRHQPALKGALQDSLPQPLGQPPQRLCKPDTERGEPRPRDPARPTPAARSSRAREAPSSVLPTSIAGPTGILSGGIGNGTVFSGGNDPHPATSGSLPWKSPHARHSRAKPALSLPKGGNPRAWTPAFAGATRVGILIRWGGREARGYSV
jgi:hypothetical protein